MSDSEHESISMSDLRAGLGEALLADAEVIIAVPPESEEEEVLFGKWDWELAVGTGHDLGLSVVRVELDASDDVDDLKRMIETVRSDSPDEDVEPTDDDAD